MTYLETIASLFGLSMLLTPTAGVSFGDGIGIGTMNPWKYSGSTITISSTTASLRIPGLTNCDTIDTNGSGIFTCGTDASGSGGGSGTVSTSTNETAGRLSYWTSTAGTPALLGEVATTTLTAASPLSLSQSVVKVGGSNSVLSLDTSGAWTGTASALAANGGNCSAGNFPLGVDTLGAVETCTDAWTQAENDAAAYTPQSRTLTVAGTANQVTSSAGAQDLSANRTWTLSLPSHVIFPGNFQATNATTTNATTTGSFYLSALNCTGNANGGALTVDANGLVSCSDDNSGGGGSGGGSWSTTTSQVAGQLINYPNNDTDVVAIGANSTTTSEFWFDPNNSRSRIPFASSTAMTIVSAYLTNLFIGADTIAEYIADTAGAMFTGNTETDITVTYDDADNTVDLVVDTLPNLTGTLDYDSGGTGSTTAPVGQLLYGGATAYQSVATSSASCTDGVACSSFIVVGTVAPSLTATLGTSITAAEIADGDHGDFTYTSGVAAIDTNAVVLTTDTTGNYVATLADDGQTTVTVTNGSTEGGAATLRVIDVVCTGCLGTTEVAGLDISADTNLAVTYPIVLTNDTVSIAFGTTTANSWSVHNIFSSAFFTLASSTYATTSSLYITGLTSALVQTDGSGQTQEYAGTSCTNQVPTALSALGIATCSSINNAFWSGTDLSVANGGTGVSTFGGTDHVLYTTAADTLASEAAFAYSASADRLTVVNASTTDLTIGGAVEVGYETIGFTYATTSWTGTTTIYLAPAMGLQTFDNVYCETTVGTLGVSLYDGTNRATPYIPTASTTINLNVLTANNTFTKGETRRVDIGTPVSSPRQIACTFKFRYIDDA